jgi:aconitase A
MTRWWPGRAVRQTPACGRTATAEYERVLKFDLSTVVRIAGPSNPHKRVPTSELAARGISGGGE